MARSSQAIAAWADRARTRGERLSEGLCMAGGGLDESGFVALALYFLDQAGLSVQEQDTIAGIVARSLEVEC